MNTFTVVTNSANMPGEVKFCIRWMQPNNNNSLDGGNLCVGFDTNNVEWTGTARDYQLFAITGVKYQWTPGQMQQPGEQAGTNMNVDGVYFVNDLNVNEDVTLNGVTLGDLMSRRDVVKIPY